MKVKVRIAVAVDVDGYWNSCGWKGSRGDDEIIDYATDAMSDPYRIYILEAELDAPEPKQTVQANVIFHGISAPCQAGPTPT